MVMETYLILATGKAHSEIRGELGSKGRICFAPLPALFRVREREQTAEGN